MIKTTIKRVLFSKCLKIPILYLSMLSPRKANLMLFGAWLGKKYDDNSRYLFEYVVNNRPDIQAVWLSSKRKVVNEVAEKGYPVCYSHSLRGIKLALRARYAVGCVSTFGGDFGGGMQRFFGNAVTVNTWHGVPLKKIKYDDEITFKKKFNKSRLREIIELIPHKKRYYIATSDVVVDRYIGCFRSDKDHVFNLGYARNDYFYTEHSNPLRQLFLGEKNDHLYADPSERRACAF